MNCKCQMFRLCWLVLGFCFSIHTCTHTDIHIQLCHGRTHQRLCGLAFCPSAFYFLSAPLSWSLISIAWKTHRSPLPCLLNPLKWINKPPLFCTLFNYLFLWKGTCLHLTYGQLVPLLLPQTCAGEDRFRGILFSQTNKSEDYNRL